MKAKTLRLVGAALGLTLLLAFTPAAASADIIDLGTLGGSFSAALDINSANQIVGYSQTSDGSFHAFLWEDGVMTDLGVGLGASSNASAVNDLGHIAGTYRTTGGESRAVKWVDGAVIELSPYNSEAWGINNQGDVVGRVNGTTVIWYSDGTSLEIAGLREPDVINDSGWVLGIGTNGHAAIFRDGVIVNFEGLGSCCHSTDIDMNNSGQAAITEGGRQFNPYTHADNIGVLWDGADYTLTYGAMANAINDDGVVGGIVWHLGDKTRGYIWDAGALFELSEFTPNEFTWITGINNAAYVAGISVTSSGESHAVMWTPLSLAEQIISLRSRFEEHIMNDLSGLTGSLILARLDQAVSYAQAGQSALACNIVNEYMHKLTKLAVREPNLDQVWTQEQITTAEYILHNSC